MFSMPPIDDVHTFCVPQRPLSVTPLPARSDAPAGLRQHTETRRIAPSDRPDKAPDSTLKQLDKVACLLSMPRGSTVRLSADDPNHEDCTSQVATALSEAVRVLNHATPPQAGFTCPSTVPCPIGQGAIGLDQLLRQRCEVPRRMLPSAQLREDHGDPSERVDSALSRLAADRAAARTLTARLDHASNAIAGLHATDGRED
jgi:hypothetical protein